MTQIPRRERERLARRDEIVAAAKEVFAEKGFEGASMDEIARRAQFTKRTVYQYFPSKDDLYFAVALAALDLMMTTLRGGQLAGTGLERVRATGEAYYQFLREHPDSFMIINYSQVIRTDYASSPNYQKMAALRAELFEGFAGIIAGGQDDGSIRGDLKPAEAALAVFLLVTGFFQRVAQVGPVYGFGRDNVVRLTLDLIDDALRPRTATETP